MYLHLGSNEGDREKSISDCIRLLEEKVGNILAKSSLYETEAWGVKEQPDFLNQALEIITSLAPREVLDEIKTIEHSLGRAVKVKWGQRKIDIDILFYDDEIINTEHLNIPHPQLEKRNFVLVPMLEIAGDKMHPTLNKTIEELYDECRDDGEVMIYDFSS